MSDLYKFIAARESARLEAGSSDGTTWPIQVMEAGFAHGEVATGDPQFAGLPHYFPVDVVAQVAEACNNARFGRRHPEAQTDESDPNRMAGWLDGGRMEGNAARATMHLFDNEKDLQAKLLAARNANKLDLFATSILAYFAWRKEKVDGRDALVAKKLGRLVSVDMVTEAGAGGKFLAYAAALSSQAEIAVTEAEMICNKFRGGEKMTTVQVGRESRDKIQLAMDAMLGVKEARKDPNVRPFRGVKEAYVFCTGDDDFRFDRAGFFRVSEAIATTDFPNILLSSLTKKLIQDYQEYQIVPGLEKLYVSTILGDYKPQDRVRMGYLGDLPTVAEAGPYVELTKPTDEKITYSPLKKGGLLTISEETIRNDDLGKIAQFPNRLARAARHTLATFVSNFFITPPNFDPDGVAWFHATHANLGATALSAAELDARAIALAKQTEKDSGNRLGLTLDWIMIPIDLRPTAMQINRNMTGTNNWYEKFGVNEENIIVNPLLTDVNDWFGGCFPSSAPFLEIGFLDGYQTPQLFIANLPTQGTQFTNDQLQYKAKFVFGGKPIDYRGVFKEVV